MSSYRQLPEVFRRLHPRFKTPWLALIVFAGVFSILFMLPGNVDFIGRMYAFGAMLSFTIAHVSLIQMRRKPPPVEEPYHVRPNLRVRGVDWPLFAILGGAATAVAWLVVVVQDAPTRYAGFAWLVAGFVFYAIYRHRLGIPLRETVRAPILLGPAIALEYRTILVPIVSGRRGRRRSTSPRASPPSAAPRSSRCGSSSCRSTCRSTPSCPSRRRRPTGCSTTRGTWPSATACG